MNLIIDTTITYQHLQNSSARTQHHLGGTRSGKTYGILQWLIVQAIQTKMNISIVRKSLPAMRRSVIKDFRDIMRSLEIWDGDRWNDTNRTYNFDSDAVITFFSADDEGKLRGVKADITWVDESNELSEDEGFQLAIRTTKKIIYSYNPTISPYHWLRQQYGNKDVDVYRTTYLDNPFITAEQRMAIEELKDKNPKYWAIYGKGEFAGNERQIYTFETYTELPNDADFVCFGMDFGYSTDPTALVGVWKWGDNIYLKEFLYERGLTTGDIVSRLSKISSNREEIWGDSAEPRLIEEIYRSGYNIKPVTKGKDSVKFGINNLLNYKIHLDAASQNLINEMYGYQWAQDKNGYTTDIPEGGLDHLLDAARYAGMMRLTKKAENKGRYTISIR